MKDKKISLSFLFVLLTTALFMAAFLLLTFIGAHVYRNVVRTQEENGDRRAVNSYIVSSLKEKNPESIRIETLDNGQDLIVILEEGTKYANKLYVYDGNLVSEFSKTDASLKPESAMVIGKTKTLSVEDENDHLFVITTDYGIRHVKKNEKGGSDE